ncbi:cation-translocating P-type ATPase [Microbacterium thalassium]|uniref:Ca2+-transporting ATPase n=1 Tax=Microbacterium thalassium TaxID=362649 RepID=A0A7X0FP88_9MICO|nr:cation-translocating P-type ATPase [Microbacterium thalassium]MBB6391175.1 Ca2+-transporting ATPase [Microbacterium thalassium]GLK23714.1 ATPase [Microbacterium thalassium]
MTATETSSTAPWFARDADDVLASLGSDRERGLSTAEADKRLAERGPNAIASEPPPSVWQVALRTLADPMNIMLVAVAIISMFINQISVGILVGALVILNVVLGTRQEMKALASVDALAKMQIPQARVTRDASLKQVDATTLVPGDVLQLEAGDVVPADARILRSATLETQEAALTGESAPIAKDAATVADPETTLGDRSDMVYQNTQVTRGTATAVVTATGMDTEMGRIASMLSAVKHAKSPLQRELDSLTGVLGWIAWGAVAVIIVVGLVRGQEIASVVLLGISMAISAIPTGLPTFVQGMLSYGSQQLAEHNAVVKNLTDVETLGATSAINSDKTGTLTMNEMTVESLYYLGDWYSVAGSGYAKSGEIRGSAGHPVPDFERLAYGLTLCSDATVSDDGEVVGDPTEAALIVLAAKMGVDAELTRAEYPRLAEVPFDSEYKFMATFHRVNFTDTPVQGAFVKGGPDVVLARCTTAATSSGVVPIDEQRDAIVEANRKLSEQGLRVLAFAVRRFELDAPLPADPMSAVEELTFVGLVGIIDPLRPSSKEAVRIASEAGIEVRMITGDHAITAAAIGAKLGLGPGAASGADIQAMSDEELKKKLPDLHVFGRVTPQDKLRLARLMQEDGAIVAMTGDAVNDAAALKQADIGVAMGSGSEVTKQAGKMILVDDNFGTLVTAVKLGRAIYDKVVGYVRFQMSQLFALVILFLAASLFDINNGVPLSPIMVLFLNFFITVFPVIVIMLDPAPADIMRKPPRDPKKTIANRGAVTAWLIYGGLLFIATLVPLLALPGQLSSTEPNVPVTMAFVVMALGSVFYGLVLRRDPESGLSAPILGAVKWLAIPFALTIVAVEVGFMQAFVGTTSLTGTEWLASLGLAVAPAVLIELGKAVRRSRARS